MLRILFVAVNLFSILYRTIKSPIYDSLRYRDLFHALRTILCVGRRDNFSPIIRFGWAVKIKKGGPNEERHRCHAG